MTYYSHAILAFLKSEDGPTAAEYAVMLALILAVCIGAITTLGQNANTVFGNVALNTAVTVTTCS
jgi:pilus assembly protein Flp/PilA